MAAEPDYRCYNLASDWIDVDDLTEKEGEREINSLAIAIESAINAWLRLNGYETDETLEKLL